jgi:hypothetical protein
MFVFVISHPDRPHIALDTAATLEDVVAALTARPGADLTVCVNDDGLTRGLDTREQLELDARLAALR